MKIFRNDVCYVNIKDLMAIEIPSDITFDKRNYSENEYVKLTEKKDIEFIRNREDIIDYDYVSSLDEDTLDENIKKIEHDLDPYYQLLKTSLNEERIVLFKNVNFKKEFFKLDKVYYDLIHYRNNKEQEDEIVSTLLNEPVLKKLR